MNRATPGSVHGIPEGSLDLNWVGSSELCHCFGLWVHSNQIGLGRANRVPTRDSDEFHSTQIGVRWANWDPAWDTKEVRSTKLGWVELGQVSKAFVHFIKRISNLGLGLRCGTHYPTPCITNRGNANGAHLFWCALSVVRDFRVLPEELSQLVPNIFRTLRGHQIRHHWLILYTYSVGITFDIRGTTFDLGLAYSFFLDL